MAGLVPAIHVLFAEAKTWMPGTRPGMTVTGYNNPRFAKLRISAAAPKRHGGARLQAVTTLTKAPSFSDAIVTTSPS